MRILTVAGWISPDVEGGSFRVVFELARGLAARGHEVHLLTQMVPGHEEARQTIHGVEIHRYRTWATSGWRFYVSSIRAVWGMVSRMAAVGHFDALHLHHPVSALGATLCGSSGSIPTLHTFYVPYFLEYAFNNSLPADHPGAIGRVLRWIDHHNLRRSDAIAVLSEFTLGQIEEHFADCASRCRIIPAGVDLDAFAPTAFRADARERLGLPCDGRLVLTVRRLEPRMGLENLIDAVALLREKCPDVRLIIAGRGSLHERLAERIEQLDLGSTITLAGFVPEDDLPLMYQAADCFVVPTVALEGFGMVTAEALACGTPVLGTPVGATPELLEPLDRGLVMKSSGPADMAQALGAFLNRGNLDDWRDRCREYAGRQFNWNRTVGEYELLLKGIVKQ